MNPNRPNPPITWGTEIWSKIDEEVRMEADAIRTLKKTFMASSIPSSGDIPVEEIDSDTLEITNIGTRQYVTLSVEFSLDEEGREKPRGEIGNLAARLPLPPAALPTLWNADDRFREAYLARYPGFYDTSDAGMVDGEGYVWVMGRTDDIINVAGHRLSTGAMEEVLSSHKDVAECAVIGVKDSLKGQAPMGLVVLKAGVRRPEAEVAAELVALVRERIGPVAAFKDARVVPRLPKTRSGKILRATMRSIADGENYAVPPTIDDPAILQEMEGALRR